MPKAASATLQGDAAGAFEVGPHHVAVAVDGRFFDSGASHMVVQKHPQCRALLPVDESHHGLGDIVDGSNPQRVALGHHQAFLQKGETQDQSAHSSQLPGRRRDVRLGLVRVVQVRPGRMGRVFGQAVQGSKAGGETAMDASVGRRAADMAA
jgi:hypothetical protein